MKTSADPAETIARIQSGHRIFVHGAAATPSRLLAALVADADRLRDVEIFQLHTVGEAEYAKARHRKSFKISAFFVGENLRADFDPGHVDYLPCFLSEIPQFFRSGRLPLDVALIHVSPPDRHGFCSLGTSVDATKAAVDTAKIIIAQINPAMPRVHGDGMVHVSQIHHAIEVDDPIPEVRIRAPLVEEESIATYAASLIEDGSTLQMGIGGVPESILGALKDHRHLGVHTEMWTDGALALIRSGAGGQMDFIRGASLSEGGKPIIALTSRTQKGVSRIVPMLKPGAGVVTTRAHVHYVITEHGIADLYGKTLAQRAKELIRIANPADREWLERSWRATYRPGAS